MLKRYTDLFIYSLVTIIFVEMARKTPFLIKLLTEYADFVIKLPLLVKCLWFFLWGGILFKFLTQLKILSMARMGYPSWRYPPLYWSVYFVLFCYLFNSFGSEQLNFFTDALVLQYFLYSFIGYLVFYIYLKCTYSKNKVADINYADRNEWVKSEQPVEHTEDLKFDRGIYVKRIISRLSKEYDALIALCGVYGSGKSSITNSVASELCQKGSEKQWVIVKIDSWGRNIETTNNKILQAIVEKASEFIDVSGFFQLPNNYQEALKAKRGWFGALNSFIANYDTDYLDQLQGLDNIFQYLNINVLVILEDMDRNDNVNEYCSEVASLLDRLKTFKSYRFIVSVGYNLEVAEVISRVCNYREDLDKIDYSSDIDNWFNIWIERARGNNILLSEKYVSEFSLKGQINQFLERSPIKQRDTSINSLINTPRIFKHVIRRVDEMWEKNTLMGEIDLIDLFLIQLIREVAPSLFNLIVEYEKILINGVPNKTRSRNGDDKDQETIDKINDIFADVLNKYENSLPLMVCLDCLFPAWSGFKLADTTSSLSFEEQKISSSSNVINYMSRVKRGKLTPQELELSDQKIISDLKDYVSYEGTDKERYEKFISKIVFTHEYFERLFTFYGHVRVRESAQNNNFERFCVDVIEFAKRKYEDGSGGSLRSMRELVTQNWWILNYIAKQVYRNFSRPPEKLTKDLLSFLISRDLDLTAMLLENMPITYSVNFQCDLIKVLKQSIEKQNNSVLYDGSTNPEEFYRLCDQLSLEKGGHKDEKQFLQKWSWLLELLLQQNSIESNNVKHLAIVMVFIMDERDRNYKLQSEVQDLDNKIKTQIKQRMEAISDDELSKSYGVITVQRVKAWRLAIQELAIEDLTT